MNRRRSGARRPIRYVSRRSERISSTNSRTRQPGAVVPEALPPNPAYLFGRDTLCHQLADVILSARPPAIALRGHAGQGKTAVARALLHTQAICDHFGLRRWFVRCEVASTREDLISAIARAMGIAASQYAEEQVMTELRKAPSFLVLDNIETPWEKAQSDIEALLIKIVSLSVIQNLSLLITIRGLEMPGGVAWSPLGRIDQLEPAAAKQLFLSIAGAHLGSDPKLGALLSDLDNLALAVELLAHQAQGQSDLEDLWIRWQSEKTELLQRSSGTMPHTNLALSIDLSVKSPRMTAAAKHLLALLSALPAGMERSDIRELFGPKGAEGSAILCKISLAIEVGTRIRLLVPVRLHINRYHYHLAEPSEINKAYMYILSLVRKEGRALFSHNGNNSRIRLNNEFPNLQIIVEQLLRSYMLNPIFKTLFQLIDYLGSTELSVHQLLEQVYITASRAGKSLPMGVIDYIRGQRALSHGQIESSLVYHERALELFVSDGSYRQGEAISESALAELSVRKANFEDATSHNARAYAIFQEIRDWNGQGHCVRLTAQLARIQGRLADAEEAYAKAQALYRKAGHPLGDAHCIMGLGIIQRLRKADRGAAVTYFQRAREIYQLVGDLGGEANCISEMAELARIAGTLSQAENLYNEAENLYGKLGYALGIATCKRSRALILEERGHLDAASKLLAEACSPEELKLGKERSYCILGMAYIAQARGELDESKLYYEESLNGIKASGADPQAQSYCLGGLASIALIRLALGEAETLFQEMELLLKDTSETPIPVECMLGKAYILLLRKQLPAAERAFLDILGLSKDLRIPRLSAQARFGYAETLRRRGQLRLASEQFLIAQEEFRQIELFRNTWMCTLNLAEIAFGQGFVQTAEKEYTKAREYFYGIGDALNCAESKVGLAVIERTRGGFLAARQLYREANETYKRCKIPHLVKSTEDALNELCQIENRR